MLTSQVWHCLFRKCIFSYCYYYYYYCYYYHYYYYCYYYYYPFYIIIIIIVIVVVVIIIIIILVFVAIIVIVILLLLSLLLLNYLTQSGRSQVTGVARKWHLICWLKSTATGQPPWLGCLNALHIYSTCCHLISQRSWIRVPRRAFDKPNSYSLSLALARVGSSWSSHHNYSLLTANPHAGGGGSFGHYEMMQNIWKWLDHVTWVLTWEYPARAFQRIPIWEGLDGFQKS